MGRTYRAGLRILDHANPGRYVSRRTPSKPTATKPVATIDIRNGHTVTGSRSASAAATTETMMDATPIGIVTHAATRPPRQIKMAESAREFSTRRSCGHACGRCGA